MTFTRFVPRSLLLLTLLAGCGDDAASTQASLPAGAGGVAGSGGTAGTTAKGGSAGKAGSPTGKGGNAGNASAGNGGAGATSGGTSGTSGSAGKAATGGSAGTGGASAGAAGGGASAGAGASGSPNGGAGGANDGGSSGASAGGVSGANGGGASGASAGGPSGGSAGEASGGSGGGTSGGSAGGSSGSNAGGSSGGGPAGAGGNGNPNDVCPGIAVSIPVGDFHVSGTTVGATHGASPDDCEGADTAPDVVYALVPEATGSLIFDVSDTFGTKAYLRTSCDDAKSQIACAWISGVAQVEKGKTYYLFVDGFAQASGAFSIAFTLEETCGNALFDEGEECDDGNLVPNDGCDALCRFEPQCRSQEKESNGFATPNAVGPSSCRTLLVDGTLSDTDTDWFAVPVPAQHAVEAYPFGPVGECTKGKYLVAIRDAPPASNGTTTCPNNPTCQRHDVESDPCLVSLPFPQAGTAYVRVRNLTTTSTPYTLSVTLFPF